MPSQISERAFLVIREDLPACGVHIPGAPRALIRKNKPTNGTPSTVVEGYFFLCRLTSLERARLVIGHKKTSNLRQTFRLLLFVYFL